MGDSQAVNEGSNADRLAVIRRRAERIEHMSYLDAAQMAARVALSEDVPWLLDQLAEAEARAEKAERALAEFGPLRPDRCVRCGISVREPDRVDGGLCARCEDELFAESG